MSDHPAIRLAEEAAFRLGILEVTPAKRQVAWNGKSRTLEPRVMQVLVVLAGSRGDVVGRDELIRRCWDGRVVGDNAINRVISLLRDLAAETGAFELETVIKVGYRLTETGAPTDRPEASRRGVRFGRPGVIALVAVAVLAVLAGWLFIRFGPASREQGRVEVAVFDARRDDPDLRRLAAGVQDSMLAALTRTGIDTAPAGAAGARRAELRVSGSVDRQGDQVVITAQVEDGRSGLVLSSLKLDRPAGATAGFADQVALGVTAGLDCALSDRRQSRQPFPPNILALYLNACDAVAREANTQRMLETGRKLVAAAPKLAAAHALYGIAQANAATEADDPAAAEALRAGARSSAAKALSLDPRTPKAYLAIANSYPAGGHWAVREANYLKAHAIDPNLNPGRISYIALLREVGRLDAARAIAEQVMASGDPRTATYARIPMISIAGSQGDLDTARRVLKELERSDPQLARQIGWLVAITYEEPEQALARLRALGPEVAPNTGAYVCNVTFLEELPGRIARRAHGLPAACDIAPPSRRAQMLAREGDIDGAFAEADRALSSPDVFAAFLFFASTKSLRSDPRFMALAAKAGLTDYWRKSGHWPDFCAEPGLPYDCKAVAAAPPPVRLSVGRSG